MILGAKGLMEVSQSGGSTVPWYFILRAANNFFFLKGHDCVRLSHHIGRTKQK